MLIHRNNILQENMKKPANYYCHRNVQGIQKQQISDNDVQIVEKIGQGSFGTVYKVFDPKQSKLMVVKKKKQADQLGFSQQAYVLNELSSSDGFKSLQINKKSSSNQLYMECLGLNLGQIINKNHKMNSYTVKRIGKQLVQKLKQMHSCRFIHRDIKPDNILLGNQTNPHSINLVDFGLATTYKAKSTKAKRIFNGLIGTAKFCPLASHYGQQQFPKDDLESLGYVLSYFAVGKLPWQNLNKKNQAQLFQQIKILKQKTKLESEDIYGSLNCLRKFFKYIYLLNVGDKVNYEEILSFFSVENDSLQYCYDFCEPCKINCSIMKMKKNKTQKRYSIQENDCECKASKVPVSIIEQS